MMKNSALNESSISLQEVQGLQGWVACWRNSSDRAASTFNLQYPNEGTLPAISKTDSCVVVFEGALQNRDEVLHALGENLQWNSSDADVILAAYSRWEEDFLEKLKGVFLLAVWDKKRNTFLCVRDRTG